MTTKTKKTLLICAAIVIGSYIARSFINSYRQMVYARQQMIQQQQKPRPTAPVGSPEISTLAAEAAALGNFSGAWEGRGSTPAGICNLHLELKQGDPGHYTGYSRFSCIPVQSMLEAPKNANTMMSLMQNTAPVAAILTGAVEKGAIQLHTDKTIGAEGKDCSMSELTITPFGASAVAAEWKEGSCQGGNLMMQRVAR